MEYLKSVCNGTRNETQGGQVKVMGVRMSAGIATCYCYKYHMKTIQGTRFSTPIRIQHGHFVNGWLVLSMIIPSCLNLKIRLLKLDPKNIRCS